MSRIRKRKVSLPGGGEAQASEWLAVAPPPSTVGALREALAGLESSLELTSPVNVVIQQVVGQPFRLLLEVVPPGGERYSDFK